VGATAGSTGCFGLGSGSDGVESVTRTPTSTSTSTATRSPESTTTTTRTASATPSTPPGTTIYTPEASLRLAVSTAAEQEGAYAWVRSTDRDVPAGTELSVSITATNADGETVRSVAATRDTERRYSEGRRLYLHVAEDRPVLSTAKTARLITTDVNDYATYTLVVSVKNPRRGVVWRLERPDLPTFVPDGEISGEQPEAEFAVEYLADESVGYVRYRGDDTITTANSEALLVKLRRDGTVVAERDWLATERDETVETFDQFVIGPSRDADIEEPLRGTDSLRVVWVAPDGDRVDLATLRVS